MTNRQESAVHDTGQDEKAAGGGSEAAQARRWVDDLWGSMTTGEAEAWRAGWEAAKGQAAWVALRVSMPPRCTALESRERIAGSITAAFAIAAMKPKP